MDISRPSPPEEIKRQLRQESGFGCAKCGYPIFDYHHIVPWAQEHHFRPEDMVILCPNHHREADVMIESEQRKYKNQPYNILHGYVEGRLKINQQALAVVTGPIEFVNEGKIICINNEPLLRLGKSALGTLNISLQLFDENDKLSLLIENNEWIYGDPKVWDLLFKYNKLSILKKSRSIAIVIDASSQYVSIRGTFWRNKKKIVITDSDFQLYTALGKPYPKFSIQHICYVNAFINFNMEGDGNLEFNPTNTNGSFWVTRPNRDVRIEEGVATYLAKGWGN